MAITIPTDPAERLWSHQQEYLAHQVEIDAVQRELRADIGELAGQEDWDVGVCKGIEEWLDDRGSIWRALRRSKYDLAKAHNHLLATLTHRISLQLHLPIPHLTAYKKHPFFILPQQFTTRLHQPVVVITLRDVVRDDSGSLDELKEWTWWALEMVRRVLRGRKGEGCVLLIDASGAGYRNLEVELLPTLLSVGHNHFPSVFDSVLVVGAGWTHRSMWGIVRRVLPRSAIEKIRFLDSESAIAVWFDRVQWPKPYGGTVEWKYSSSKDTVFQQYSSATSYDTSIATPSPVSTTPESSRPVSRRSSHAALEQLRMTRANTDFKRTAYASHRLHRPQGRSEVQAEPEQAKSPFEDDFAQFTAPSVPAASYKEAHRRSAPTSPTVTPLQRIKSLSDFHLYLSPSRLAHLDVLSDSDSDASEIEMMPPPRRELRPLILGPSEALQVHSSLAARRMRPGLQLHGSHEQGVNYARSYSGAMGLHHAQILKEYHGSSEAELKSVDDQPSQVAPPVLVAASDPEQPAPIPLSEASTDLAPSTLATRQISAYSHSLNPWFGYPALLTRGPDGSVSLIPRYVRRRNRDLLKTLLFLAMLRLQVARDSVERFLGLRALGGTPWARLRSRYLEDEGERHLGPAEGLERVEQEQRRKMGLAVRDDKWKYRAEMVWAVVGLVLFRGAWFNVIERLAGLLGLGV